MGIDIHFQANPNSRTAFDDGGFLVGDIASLGDDIQSGRSLSVIENDIAELSSDLSQMESIVTESNGFTVKQVDVFTSELEGTVNEILHPNLNPGEDAATYWMSHDFTLGLRYSQSMQDNSDFDRSIGMN